MRSMVHDRPRRPQDTGVLAWQRREGVTAREGGTGAEDADAVPNNPGVSTMLKLGQYLHAAHPMGAVSGVWTTARGGRVVDVSKRSEPQQAGAESKDLDTTSTTGAGSLGGCILVLDANHHFLHGEQALELESLVLTLDVMLQLAQSQLAFAISRVQEAGWMLTIWMVLHL